LAPNPPVKTSRAPLCVLILAVLALGGYASWLNHQFYLRQAPFFDSASYTNYLARVMGATQMDSVKDGFEVALEASTAPLPGLEAWLLAMLHVPVTSLRQLGVGMQVLWLLALALSLYFYWLHDRLRGPWTSVLLTLPFLSFGAVFHYDGGLPDFRLDLSLYLLLAAASVWYLRTYSIDSRTPWLLTGIFVTLACVNRATAPVYWIVIAGPLLLVRFVVSSDKKRLLQGVAWMILPTVVVALPYFLLQFSFLYYYYAQWNLDANAHLPWRSSLMHVTFALRHLGLATTISAVVFFATVLCDNRRSLRVSTLDWKLLYMGCAPVLFLVVRGAGLNPFVSLPAVFGCLLFLLAPVRGSGPILRSACSKCAGLILLAACAWHAARAPGQVGYPETHMSAIRQGIDWMREDALRKKLPRVDFVALHNWNYHPDFVRNVLINEYGYRASRWFMVSPEGIPWEPFHVWKHLEASYQLPFTSNVAVVWREDVEGSTDEEKIEWMLRTARRDIDYLFIPDDATIDFMEKYIGHNFINTKVRSIKNRFLDSGEWEAIGTPMAITDFERVQLYTKRR
jgi:hypothetical protein